MFSFGNPFDADIEKATSEKNTSEDWGLILDICDKVDQSPTYAKNCFKAIIKRLNHADPHVVLKAIILLNACVVNCKKQFHLEIASREFEGEYRRLLSKSHPVVQQRLKESLRKWSESEFKSDPQLALIPSLYAKLRHEGLDFSTSGEEDMKGGNKGGSAAPKDPDVVSEQQEVDDIARAIELSLRESKAATTGGLYPVAGLQGSAPGPHQAPAPAQEPRKVRALYDFEAAEDNELTFHAGEIIQLVDDSDLNWWKGQNQRGEGLFPANFVTRDLEAAPQGEEAAPEQPPAAQAPPPAPEISEDVLERLLGLLHEADPGVTAGGDERELRELEARAAAMGPLVDQELERVDRSHARLTQLSADLVDALNLYHTLMREPQHFAPVPPPPQAYYQPPGPAMYYPPPQHHLYQPPPPDHAPPAPAPYTHG